MGAPIPLRKDCNGKQLRGLAYRSVEGSQSCRLLALAAIYDGQDRTAAARVAGVEPQIIRKWVLRFNAQGPEGLKDRKAEGPAHKLNQQQREALAAIVESGPDPRIHGVVRWRLCDLVGWIKENFPVSMVETTVGRELRRMGYVKLSARPRHYAQDKAELEAFKKRGLLTIVPSSQASNTKKCLRIPKLLDKLLHCVYIYLVNSIFKPCHQARHNARASPS